MSEGQLQRLLGPTADTRRDIYITGRRASASPVVTTCDDTDGLDVTTSYYVIGGAAIGLIVLAFI